MKRPLRHIYCIVHKTGGGINDAVEDYFFFYSYLLLRLRYNYFVWCAVAHGAAKGNDDRQTTDGTLDDVVVPVRF